MNKFTKCMTAIAVSALLAGPAVALDFDANYAGTKGQVKFSGSGCSGDNHKDLVVTTRAYNFPAFGMPEGGSGPNTGQWTANFVGLPFPFPGSGSFIISKNGKEVLDWPKKATFGLSDGTFGGLVNEVGNYAFVECKNISLIPGFDPASCQQTKGDAKMSKDGDQLKYKLDMQCMYENDKGNDKKVQVRVTSGRLDRI